MRAIVIFHNGNEISDSGITKIVNSICNRSGSSEVSVSVLSNAEIAKLIAKGVVNSKSKEFNKEECDSDEETRASISFLTKLCGDPEKEPIRFISNLKMQCNSVFVDGLENKNLVKAIHKLAENYENKKYYGYLVSKGISSSMIQTIYQLHKLFLITENV